MSRASARRLAKAAGALSSHPIVGRAVASGFVSIDQAIPLCGRLDSEGADAEREAFLTEAAIGCSVDELERQARLTRPVPEEEAKERHRRRRLRMRWDKESGMRLGWFALPDVEGAAVERALRRRAGAMPKNPETGAYDPIECRLADALYEVCAQEVASDSDPDRATVVLFRREGHAPEVRFGPVVPESTWERVMCDSRVQVVTTDDDGESNGIEDMSRSVSIALRRLVEERFGSGCAFPGCGRSETLLHCHHIIHSCEGGPTCPWNLVLLRLSHESRPSHRRIAARGTISYACQRARGRPRTALFAPAVSGGLAA